MLAFWSPVHIGVQGGGMHRSAIVTGGASGIGLAIARRLVERGLHVVVADIDGDSAAAAADRLGRTAVGTRLDVADAQAVGAVVDSTHDRHGRLDFLFNNAGIGASLPIEQIDLAHWQRTLEVNLSGVIHGCRAAYPHMVRQGFGRIVNTASVAGIFGGLGTAVPYATSKHAVVGLSLAWRVAAAPHGVGIHVVCPGGTDTPMLDKVAFPGLDVPTGAARSMRAQAADMGVRRFYSADRLARDVFRGVARGRALIVAPASARLSWRLYRMAPEPLLRFSAAMSERQSREGGGARSTSSADPWTPFVEFPCLG
jgi:NAD(P)-dependent dehydrogenase (short-subunit alcohol dehydrogenase family)